MNYIKSYSEFVNELNEQRINEISDALVNRAALNAKQKYGHDGYGVVYPNIRDRDDNSISATGGKIIFGSNEGNLVRRFIHNNSIINSPEFKFAYILYFDHKDGEYNGQDLFLNVYPNNGYLRFGAANPARCDINRILNLPVLPEMLKSIYNDLKENAGPDIANIQLPKFIKASIRSISFDKDISYQTI